MQKCMIAVGANAESVWGDPYVTVKRAFKEVESALGVEIRTSRLYCTPAFPAGAGPDFVNAAGCFEAGHAPEVILAALHAVEAAAGRERVVRWGARTLDLDLLGCGAAVLPDTAGFRHWLGLSPDMQQQVAPDQLILPHPRLSERAFVLVPLADVAPEWRHPVLGRSVTEMRDDLPRAELDAVRAL